MCAPATPSTRFHRFVRGTQIAGVPSLYCILALTAGCGPKIPLTPGDPRNAPAYGYTPLDPIPVVVEGATSPTPEELLKALPDETMRLAVGDVTTKGGVTFGPAKVGVEGRSYVVVLDYIKFTTSSFGVVVSTDAEGVRTAELAENASPEALVPVYLAGC